MKLTRTERWTLSNQYRILAALCPKEKVWLDRARDALARGYELEYDLFAEHIYQDKDVLSERDCREVLEIMSMHDALQYAYDRLPDKDGIEPWRVKFHGFDGNTETVQMAYARYVCADGERFARLDRGDDFNAHMPTLDRYRRMLQEWRKSADRNALTRDDVARIVGVT